MFECSHSVATDHPIFVLLRDTKVDNLVSSILKFSNGKRSKLFSVKIYPGIPYEVCLGKVDGKNHYVVAPLTDIGFLFLLKEIEKHDTISLVESKVEIDEFFGDMSDFIRAMLLGSYIGVDQPIEGLTLAHPPLGRPEGSSP